MNLQTIKRSYGADDNYHCSLNKMRTNMNDDFIENNFTHCYNSCIAFFIISGLFLCFNLCSGFKVRFTDLKRSYYFCCSNGDKKKKPKKRSKYNKSINKDEFTIYIICIIFLHIFEDIPQCIISIMFSIYKQMNGGSDCIIDLSEIDYSNSINLIKYNGGTNIFNIMSKDEVVEIFFVFAFLNVFISGLYGVRLLQFDIQDILKYSWYKNLMYFLIGIFLGIFCMLLILAPFWGVTWLSKDYLYLTDAQAAFLGWTSVAGLIAYCFAICLPLMFAEQLDCDCDCGCD